MSSPASNPVQHPPRAPAAGFTLVEILIVVALIVILATIAVPKAMSAKVSADESAAISTLRTICTAQLQFRSQNLVDRDRDGQGEYGWLGELCGSSPLTGHSAALAPPLVPLSLAVDASGLATKAGYRFALHLPDAAGIGLAETGANLANVAPDLAELHWTAIAWPSRYGVSGTHTFFINGQGELRKNRSAGYTGTTRIPPAGAALLGASTAAHIVGTGIATGVAGADGEVWLAVQ